MPLFVKKPVVVEARHYTGREPNGSIGGLIDWINSNGGNAGTTTPDDLDDRQFLIGTLEGAMLVRLGDWVIKGIRGEFYPCKPDIFAQTYKEV
jgi:hypothetical protein